MQSSLLSLHLRSTLLSSLQRSLACVVHWCNNFSPTLANAHLIFFCFCKKIKYRNKKKSYLNRNYLSKNTEPATFPRIVIYGIRIFHWYITIAPTHLYFFSQAFYTIAEIAKAFSYALFRLLYNANTNKKNTAVFPSASPLTFPPHTAPNSNNSTKSIRILKQGSVPASRIGCIAHIANTKKKEKGKASTKITGEKIPATSSPTLGNRKKKL